MSDPVTCEICDRPVEPNATGPERLVLDRGPDGTQPRLAHYACNAKALQPIKRSTPPTDETRLVHVPAVVADQFGISRSEARRRIALGRVKFNGKVVTDIDVPLADIDGDLRIDLECHPLADSLARMLAAFAPNPLE